MKCPYLYWDEDPKSAAVGRMKPCELEEGHMPPHGPAAKATTLMFDLLEEDFVPEVQERMRAKAEREKQLYADVERLKAEVQAMRLTAAKPSLEEQLEGLVQALDQLAKRVFELEKSAIIEKSQNFQRVTSRAMSDMSVDEIVNVLKRQSEWENTREIVANHNRQLDDVMKALMDHEERIAILERQERRLATVERQERRLATVERQERRLATVERQAFTTAEQVGVIAHAIRELLFQLSQSMGLPTLCKEAVERILGRAR